MPDPDRPTLNLSSDNDHQVRERTRILLRQRRDAYALAAVGFVITLVFSLSYPVGLDSVGRPERRLAPRLQTGIDPNDARWFELAQLPGIGPTVAHRIVEFRRHRRTVARRDGLVFHAPADLAQVKGIGPKTVQRIESFLRFGDDPTPR